MSNDNTQVNMGKYLAMGVAFGVAFGVASGNFAVGMIAGLGIAAVIGYTTFRQKNRD